MKRREVVKAVIAGLAVACTGVSALPIPVASHEAIAEQMEKVLHDTFMEPADDITKEDIRDTLHKILMCKGDASNIRVEPYYMNFRIPDSMGLRVLNAKVKYLEGSTGRNRTWFFQAIDADTKNPVVSFDLDEGTL